MRSSSIRLVVFCALAALPALACNMHPANVAHNAWIAAENAKYDARLKAEKAAKENAAAAPRNAPQDSSGDARNPRAVQSTGSQVRTIGRDRGYRNRNR